MNSKLFHKSLDFNIRVLFLITILILFISLPEGYSQAEIMPWGNIRSFHVDGEKMNFETSVRSVYTDWSGCISSERCNWQGNQTYSYDGKTTRMSHFLQALPLNYAETFTETGQGSVKIDLSINATEDINQAGTYFCVEIAGSEFIDGTLDIYADTTKRGSVTLKSAIPDGKTEYIKAKGNKIIVKTAGREYEVIAENSTEIFVKQNFIDRPGYLNDPLPAKKFVASDPNRPIADYQIYFTLIDGKAKKGVQKEAEYTINVKGSIDKEDVRISIDPGKPGRLFEGVGSNYRVNHLQRDSAVIFYCLDSIRVAWGRIAFDWREWQSNEYDDPLANARAGKLSEDFYSQIEMARILAKRHIPMIVTIWSPPGWAIDSTRQNRQGLEHDAKLSLDSKKIDKMCKSIADYIEYLKTDYGIEIPLFSFNEIDYGVMVYHTPEEHAFYSKAIGKYFASRGLITKILLGDTGAGTVRSNKIVIPAVNDSTIHKFIGAIGFHTWHGCTPADLKAWSLSAQKLNVPLMVVEGGPNSAEHRYPMHFLDKWFQLSEIDLYIRICRYAQVATIMEWQLTPDYSVLIGNGLYGDNGPLRPTERFWNLKQLGSTPEGSFAIPVDVVGPNITAAAFADILDGLYTIHIVNNSAQRKAIISNIPEGIKELNVYRTDFTRGMQAGGSVQVKNGTAEVVLESACYTTVTNAIL
ncbi:MAG: hypothetical protein V2B15_02515 [Bacteroidota bacterium]